jgi:catechol 2,3-dioxygenase-like lactoylglutathione lyase family enzyme
LAPLTAWGGGDALDGTGGRGLDGDTAPLVEDPQLVLGREPPPRGFRRHLRIRDWRQRRRDRRQARAASRAHLIHRLSSRRHPCLTQVSLLSSPSYTPFQGVGVSSIIDKEGLAYLDLGDPTVELISYEGGSVEPAPENEHLGYRMMALEVDDMERTVEYLKTKRIEIVWGPKVREKYARAEIRDPNGYHIELRQWFG